MSFLNEHLSPGVVKKQTALDSSSVATATVRAR